MKKKHLLFPAIVGTLLAIVISVTFVSAAVEVDTSELREAVTTEGIFEHLQKFQEFANANGDTREASSDGYEDSYKYVADKMSAAGYDVEIQPFDYPYFEEMEQATVEQTAPGSETYEYLVDFYTMSYSGSAEVTALVEAVDLMLPPAAADNTSTSGCEAEDFDGFTPGNIALIQRGSCNFSVKAANAETAGAGAVIIFNEGQEGRQELFGGTLGSPDFDIPVLSASYEFGLLLNDLIDDELKLYIYTNAVSETRSTANVLAETPGGRDDRVVVVGAHLDSVPEGPGIQDNGSGSAAILEIAEAMSELGIEPRNKVRFAWWGAEESGLLGEYHYVGGLSSKELKNIAVNLNFDMIASPNYVPFVYDGDGSATGASGPNGSKNIESIFLEYFDEYTDVPVKPTAFDGRSDYGPFIEVGIPAGGLFTGAEEIKTEEEAAVYGGTAGEQYDPCYHLACDTIDNVNEEALDLMSDAAAHAVLTFAETTSSVNGTDKGQGKHKIADAMHYKGSHLKK